MPSNLPVTGEVLYNGINNGNNGENVHHFAALSNKNNTRNNNHCLRYANPRSVMTGFQ